MLGSLVGNNPMHKENNTSVLKYTFNLINEAGFPPKQTEQPPAAPKTKKIPPKIKSYLNKLIKDFGPEGTKSMDMKINRKIRDTLGISSGEVSKLMDKLKEGASVDELAASVAPSSDKV